MRQQGWTGLAGCLALASLMLCAPPARAQETQDQGAQDEPAAILTVHVENVRAGGLVRLGLYDQKGYDDDKGEPVAFADVPAVKGETVVTLKPVPPGTYAIEVYQDLNSNDKMDLSWIGLPLEPYGFSRDARPFLSKPSFSKVKFVLAAGEQIETLHLNGGVSVVASR
jgi:uncharacterized protein (DUF2141 family)